MITQELIEDVSRMIKKGYSDKEIIANSSWEFGINEVERAIKIAKNGNVKLVSKLVEFSLKVRVVVYENETEEEIIQASYEKVRQLINNEELGENLVSIENDTEMPYSPKENN